MDIISYLPGNGQSEYTRPSSGAPQANLWVGHGNQMSRELEHLQRKGARLEKESWTRMGVGREWELDENGSWMRMGLGRERELDENGSWMRMGVG